MLKLFALPALNRQGGFSRGDDYEHDIAVLIREYGPTMEPIFAELANHLPATDVVEVREIVAGIDRRIAESRDRFGRRGS